MCNDFLLPKAAPAPLSSEWNAGNLTGSIEFDGHLDVSVPLDPADWFRGTGFGFHAAVTMHYQGHTTIKFTSMAISVPGATPVGWKYVPGANPIRGENLLQVDAFDGFTTGE